ncbi:MAG: SWIM zinc finger family protein [Clostridia bacterium]|nr:SWIM zinc finger family protein [Clostridia bacterium]
MLNWAENFEGRILGRGRRVADEGSVAWLRHSPAGWEAMVVGTELYSVRVRLMRGRAAGMECSCPYAGDGKHCKHMAAVFFAMEEQWPEVLKDDDAALAPRLSFLSSDELEDALQLAIDANSTRCTALLLNHRSGEDQPRYVIDEFSLDDLPEDALTGVREDVQGDNDPMKLLFPGSQAV